MMRYTRFIFTLMLLAISVGWGASQDPPVKDGKAPAPQPAADDDGVKEDLKLLREHGLKGDGADLLDFFRKRTYKQPDPKQLVMLVKQLGSDDFNTREKAYVTLRDMGPSAMPAIKQGEADPDLEVRKRVTDLRQKIETKVEPILQSAAARVLARDKVDGTANVLMEFVPFATDPGVIDEIGRTLGAVALRNGAVEPILIKSLEDTNAVKRGVAAEALARGNVNQELPNVRLLLKDKDASVRLRVALALLPLKVKDTVPVMIDLLGELSANELWPVEEALVRLAGDKAPAVSVGTDAASKKACVDAWKLWYAANEKDIDLASLTQESAYMGYTLVVLQHNRIGPGVRQGAMGEVLELDKDKKVRWKFEIPTYPVDAQMLGSKRVLVAEYQGNRVTERDLPKGEVKWEYACGAAPFAVQRLSNGNTFIAMQSRLLEVDRNKTEVWSYARPQNDFVRAKKLPNGDVVFITNLGVNGTCTRMDAQTKQAKKSFQVRGVQILFGSIDVLPNGNIIVPQYQLNTVTEYDQNGKQVKTFNLQLPNSVVRLPNGNTLATSYQQRQIVEFGAGGEVRNSYQADGLVFVARRR